jgi:hypothetical protein
MTDAILEAIETIKAADGHAGGRRADILQEAIAMLAAEYNSEMVEMGNDPQTIKITDNFISHV